MDGNMTQPPQPFPLTALEKLVLSQTDDEFQYHDWASLERIISKHSLCMNGDGARLPLTRRHRGAESNELSLLKRKPSDLRRYIKWTVEIKAHYGSMTSDILARRLPRSWGPPPFTPKSQVPFDNADDYQVLLNDWPYGLEPGITHMVVWSRTVIPTDAESGDLTAESRALVQAFVDRYFVSLLGSQGKTQVLWFKNWAALQSVRSLEHLHVLCVAWEAKPSSAGRAKDAGGATTGMRAERGERAIGRIQ